VYEAVVDAWIPVSKINELHGMPEVAYAQPQSAIASTFAGSVMTQGDAVMKSDQLRTNFGLNGAGQKIGVISDSYNRLGGASTDISTGNLPSTVQIVKESNCLPGPPVGCITDFPSPTDEGRAMLQIVHDVAPAAQLAFASPDGGKSSYANRIVDLRNQGVTVIVDDIMYVTEPMFMDGLVARAANDAVTAGVPFISAAGNSANRSYEASSFVNSGQLINYGRGNVPLHDFASGAAVDLFQKITLPVNDPPGLGKVTLTLQWENPFYTDTNGLAEATHDFDVLMFQDDGFGNPDFSAQVFGGVDNNLRGTGGTGNAVEFFTYTNTSTTQSKVVHIAIAGFSTSGGNGGGRLKYVSSNPYVVINEFATNSPTSYGHANAAGVLAIGAVDALITPTPTQPQFYSSFGGVCIHFDAAGQSVTPPCTTPRQKPDIVGPDNVNTTFFGSDSPSDPDTNPNFTGTSAAAPHLAAVVALLRQLNPSASPSTLFSTLRSSAIDMNTAGYDNTTGFGRVDALEAAYRLYTPSLPDLSTPDDNGRFNNDNVTADQFQDIIVTAPPNSFIQLQRGGSQLATHQLTGGATSHTFSTGAPQNQLSTLRVRVKSSLSAPDANYSQLSSELLVYHDDMATHIPPTAPDMTAATDSGSLNTDNITTNTNPQFVGTMPAGAKVALLSDGFERSNYVLGGTSYVLNPGSTSFGSHFMSVKYRMNTSTPLNSLYDSSSLIISIDDGTAPVGTFTAITLPTPNEMPTQLLKITFNKPVDGVDLSDFVLTKNGGSNRLPSVATFSASADKKVFTIGKYFNLVMGTGTYQLSLNYPGGITSVAGLIAPTGANPSTSWFQGVASNGWQNGTRYLDVRGDPNMAPDGFVSTMDAVTIINALNNYGGQALPVVPGSAPFTSPAGLGYIDTDGDNALSTYDAILVINYMNAGLHYDPIPAFAGGGDPLPEITPDQVQVSVQVQVVNASGQPVSSVRVGEQFQVLALVVLTAPDGISPFAGFADLRYSTNFVSPVNNAADVGLAFSNAAPGLIDEAGRIVYGTDSTVIFSKTFTATKKGQTIFELDAADLYGHEIVVLGLNQRLPMSQVTFGSTTLTIKGR